MAILTDEEFLEILSDAGGQLKIEKSLHGGTSIADPFNYSQIKRLTKEGKIRSARVEVSPFAFGKGATDNDPYLKDYDEPLSRLRYRHSMPSIVYMHVTDLEYELLKEVKSILGMMIDERALCVMRKKGGHCKIAGHGMSAKERGWVSLGKTKSSGRHYYPNYFMSNTRYI